MTRTGFWTINKLIVLALLGGFVMLALELRSDHRDVLAGQPLAWAPIIFSIAMLPVGLACVGWWARGGRQVFLVCSILTLAVGLVGFYLHNQEYAGRRFKATLAAWEAPVLTDAQRDKLREEVAATGAAPQGPDSRPEPRAGIAGERQAPGRQVAATPAHGRAHRSPVPARKPAASSAAPANAAAQEPALQAWQRVQAARVPREEHEEDAEPPVLAPLSFLGLGLMGLLACWPGLQQRAVVRQDGPPPA